MKITNESAAKVMLGFVPEDINLVVMTPLTGLFYKIQEMFQGWECYTTGFYPACMLEGRNGKRILLIKAAQGIQGQDVCCLFTETVFLFIGYAGGISERVSLGKVYEVSCATKPDEREIGLGWGDTLTSRAGKDMWSKGFESVKVGYSPAMVGEITDKFYTAAKEAGCDAVDMEISYCAGTCRNFKYQNRFRALILITDIPGKRNFWDINVVERELIHAGEKTLTEATRECIREVIEDER